MMALMSDEIGECGRKASLETSPLLETSRQVRKELFNRRSRGLKCFDELLAVRSVLSREHFETLRKIASSLLDLPDPEGVCI